MHDKGERNNDILSTVELCSSTGLSTTVEPSSTAQLSSKWADLGAYLLLALGGVCYFILSMINNTGFVRSWDEVDFVLALHRFDLLAMQPHFPGYPYFVLGGIMLHKFIDNPAQALVVFNLLLTVTSLYPIYRLARLYAGAYLSAWIALCVITAPYLWVLALQPMAETAAIAVLWWFLWSISYVLPVQRSHILLRTLPTLSLFGLLMGIRVSFWPFGLGLLFIGYLQYKHIYHGRFRSFLPMLLIQTLIATLFQLIWIGGLAYTEGGLIGFFELGKSFIYGHFQEWGGTAVSTEITMSYGERLWRFVYDNILSTGLWARDWREAAFTVIVGLLVIWALWKHRSKGARLLHTSPHFLTLLLWLCAAYAGWALFAQNIEKARHITPLLGPLILFSLCMIARAAEGRSRVIVTSLCIVWFASHLVITEPLLHKQATESPAIHQLAGKLNAIKTPMVLYTWEETRVLQYLDVSFPHKRIETYAYFLAEVSQQDTRTIYITDHVLRGFEQQAGSLREHVNKVASFTSESLFDPAYSNITLYEWKH